MRRTDVAVLVLLRAEREVESHLRTPTRDPPLSDYGGRPTRTAAPPGHRMRVARCILGCGSAMLAGTHLPGRSERDGPGRGDRRAVHPQAARRTGTERLRWHRVPLRHLESRPRPDRRES